MTSGELRTVSVLLDLLSPQPAEICGTCAIKIEDVVRGFDTMVAGSLVNRYKGRAFHSSETEGCGEAYRTSAEDERIVDVVARLKRRLVSLFFFVCGFELCSW